MIAEELEILKIAVSRLESAGIEYIVSGSIAGNFYSQPRMTRDIDVVIELPPGKIDEMYNLFKDDFYIDRDSIVEALKNRRMFNIIHNEKIIKIDFIIAQDNEYEKSKFAHRIRKEIDGVKVYVISPEDLILSKLLWFTGHSINNSNFDEMILERDKERGHSRSQSTTARTNDAVVAQKRSPRRGSRLLPVCGVASPRCITVNTPSLSRLAYGQNAAFKIPIIYAMASVDSRSQMQFNDVKSILFFNKNKLDVNYLKDQAEKLGIKKNLEECLNAL